MTERDKENAATFRKTKSGKWAVMGPVEVLTKALEGDGKVDVLKKSGEWSDYTVVSLGSPFDVDGVQMCYGYDSVDDQAGSGNTSKPQSSGGSASTQRAPVVDLSAAPAPSVDEPMPVFQGDGDQGWDNAG